MGVKKGHTNTLIIAAFIIGLGVAGLMYALPGAVSGDVENIVRSNSVFLKADTAANYIEEDYMNDSMNWSFYQTSHTFGEDTDPAVKTWGPDSVASINNINSSFLDRATEDFQDNYLSDTDIPSECSLDASLVEFITHNITSTAFGVEGINYTAYTETPIKIVCDKPRARVEDYFASNITYFSAQNRFFYLANVTRHVAMADGFRDIIANTVRNSSNWAEARWIKDVGKCLDSEDCTENTDRLTDYRTWDSVEEQFEHKQAAIANPELEEELMRWLGGGGPYAGFQEGFTSLDDRYEDINITVETGIEYQVESVTEETVDEKDEGWEVYNCYQTCSDGDVDDQRSCISSTATCDADEPSPDAHCTNNPDGEQWCDTSDFGEPEKRDAGDIWTEDPWSLSHSEIENGDHTDDPFPEVESVHGMEPITESWYEPILGGEPPDPECGDQSCGTGSSECGSCETDSIHAHNGVEQRTRAQWEINELTATVTVTIIAEDRSYRTPRREGHRNMTFQAEYTQEQTWNFEGGHDAVERPEGEFDCSDADFYGRVC